MKGDTLLKTVFAAAFALAATACGTIPDVELKTLAFGSDNPRAMVAHHQDKWAPHYVRVDLGTGRLVPGSLLGDSEDSSSLYAGPINGAGTDSNYAAYIVEPGDYALVGITQANSNGYANWVDMRCLAGAAPVFRVAPGTVNVIEPGNNKNTRADAGPGGDPGASKQDEAFVKSALAGYQSISAEVKLAPVVARIQFAAANANNSVASGCPALAGFRLLPN